MSLSQFQYIIEIIILLNFYLKNYLEQNYSSHFYFEICISNIYWKNKEYVTYVVSPMIYDVNLLIHDKSVSFIYTNDMFYFVLIFICIIWNLSHRYTEFLISILWSLSIYTYSNSIYFSFTFILRKKSFKIISSEKKNNGKTLRIHTLYKFKFKTLKLVLFLFTDKPDNVGMELKWIYSKK